MLRLHLRLLSVGLVLGLAAPIPPALAQIEYEYDAIGRLVSVTYPSGKHVVYDYDDAGNRTSKVISTGTANQPPVAQDDTASVVFGQSVTFDPRGNDSDPESDPIVIAAASDGGKGAVSVLAGGTQLRYQADDGAWGTDQFSYTISDGNGGTDTAEVTVTIGANSNPVANSDFVSSAYLGSVSFDPRTNDTDPEGQGLTITQTGSAQYGQVSLNFDGSQITYTHTSDSYPNLTDPFTYTIADGFGGSATGTVTINIGSPPNNPPVAVDDALTVAFEGSANLYPLTNDSDPDGHAIMVASNTAAAKGTVSLNASIQRFDYSANSCAEGSDSFTYTIKDVYDATATATVNVTIQGTNSAPSATTDSQTVAFEDSITFDPRLNDSDPENHTLSVQSAVNGAKGTVQVVNGNTQLTYTANAGASGADSFTYTLADQCGATAQSTVNVDIGGAPNQPPVALNDSKSTSDGDSIVFDPMTNDSDPDGDELTIVSVSTPTNGGTATKNATGTNITYDPNSMQEFDDTFTYTINDGHGGEATATVTVHNRGRLMCGGMPC